MLSAYLSAVRCCSLWLRPIITQIYSRKRHLIYLDKRSIKANANKKQFSLFCKIANSSTQTFGFIIISTFTALLYFIHLLS